MDERETKLYCVTVNVFVLAESAKEAEAVVEEDIIFYPATGFSVVCSYEDEEV